MAAYDVRVENLAATPLAVLRHRASRRELSKLVTEGCGRVWKFVRARGIPAGRHVALYLDAAINLEVGVEAFAPFEDAEDVVASATPAGTAATAVHLGPYGGLGVAHEAIRRWCADNEYELAGPSWEIYGHWEDAWNSDPSRIRTDIFYQVAPRKPSS